MTINSFVFDGKCGGDMAVRHTPNGKVMGSVNVASTQGWGDHKKTSWITCKVLGERAEKLAPHLTKGVSVVVAGEFVLDEWVDKEGAKRVQPTCIVRDVSWSKPSAGREAAPSGAPSASTEFFDDDVPF